MPVQGEVRRSLRDRNRVLLKTLERTRAELDLSSRVWCDYLEVTEQEYSLIRRGAKDISALSLFKLAERLELNLDAFDTGKIDFAALVQARQGNQCYINPRYTVAASSRKFTVVNTLNFIEKHRGPHLRTQVNRHFQVNEAFWNDWQETSSQAINILFLSSLWAYLKGRGLSNADFQAIGLNTVHTLRHTHIGKGLAANRAVSEVYESLFEDYIHEFEHNHTYRITRLGPEECVLESRSNPDVAEALNVRETGSLEGCEVKKGVFNALPRFLGRSPASSYETHCVHRGDSRCRFVISFPEQRVDPLAGRHLAVVN